MGLFKDIYNLLKGMTITGKHLGRHAVTIQYPEEKWTMPERSRGVVVLLSDKETGDLNCTACLLCGRNCPTGAIHIKAPRGEDKKRRLMAFEVDHSLCCYCGLCEEACNFCAIKLATKYEFSTLERDELVWDMKKLQEVGRDVPYEDTRKRKIVRSTTPAAGDKKPVDKPAEAKGQPDAAPVNPGDDNPADPKGETPDAAGDRTGEETN